VGSVGLRHGAVPAVALSAPTGGLCRTLQREATEEEPEETLQSSLLQRMVRRSPPEEPEEEGEEIDAIQPLLQRQPEVEEPSEEVGPGPQALQRWPSRGALSPGAKIQRQPEGEEEEETLQARFIAPALHLSRLPIQTRLTVGPVGDRYEQEADAVAERVALSPGPAGSVQRQPVEEEEPIQPLSLRRQTVEEEEEPLQRQPAEVEEEAEAQAWPIRRMAERSPRVPAATATTIRSPGAGQPLPPGVRLRIEPHLGADLGDVRVHSDAGAGRAAASLGARAFTHQNHIFLGRRESSGDLPLMAHEVTHVVQQQAAPLQRVQRLFDFSLDDLPGIDAADVARRVPGYTLFTVIMGYNPLTRSDVERNATNLLQGLMELVPFGAEIFDALSERGIIQDAFTWVEDELSRLDLSRDRIGRVLDRAWERIDLTPPFSISNNLEIIVDEFGALYDDVVAFARSLVDHLMELIKEAALDLAEGFLEENEAWDLIKKILGHDPLRDEPVEATPTEILEDFLLLIGKEQHLEQMRERGTVEETANWLATQIETFMSLLEELGGLISRAWEAIQPENLPNLAENLRALATDVGGFLQRVWDFATTVAEKVLALIKDALLSGLSDFAHEVPGFHLLTVIIERNPFTGERVPRTAENLIRGFITLLPGGSATYQQLAETGTIPEAATRIEAAMSELGISWEFVVGLFTEIWESLTIEDLVDPIGAFLRIRNRFGEPISRLLAFISVVVREIFTILLELMNFPSDLIGSIISNAMQAFQSIKNDPVGFLLNMLRAVKLGFSNFFGNILTHLVGGLADWLFRGLRDAGIEPPTDLSLASILDLVLQVLGLTMDRIWEKLAERIGQETVDRIRGAIDRLVGIWNFVRDVQERGIVAIWEYIESQISNLWNMILEKAQEWVMERIINRGIQWLLSLLDPTGIMPVINSFMAFFNAVQSAIEYMRDILAIINDYVSTIAAIARGALQPGAEKMEQGLANAIPIVIGFLANQFGLGNIGEKVQEIIAAIRETIDRALEWLIDRAVSAMESLLGALGFGGAGEEEAAEGAPQTEDEAAEAAGESIPEGLPPDEVKRRVLDMVQSQLVATDVRSIRAVHRVLQSVMAANRDRGLKGLHVRVENPESMRVRVEAAASEAQGRWIAWSEIFAPSELDTNEEIDNLREDLSEASQASYAAVAVDGRQVGTREESGGGTHAEEALVRGSSWVEAIEAARQGVEANGSSRVTLMINRTPCAACVEWLKDTIRRAKSTLGPVAGQVTFVLAPLGTYRRQARMSEEDKQALKEGSERMAERLGRPFDEVYEEQEEIWKEDLRSFSTEWVADDETVYSGLSDLANAGWQIAGLEAGQPKTARQLQLARIAANLAEEFNWDV
jgi:hypothetical protein